MMLELQRFIEGRGGLAATWELHEFGMTRRSLEDVLRAGAITRVRQGWYCNPWLEVPAQQAVRVGGQLACSSAATFWNLWVPPTTDALHIAVDPNACQLRTRTSHRTRLTANDSSTCLHWTGRDGTVSRAVVSPLTALKQVIGCHQPEFALVVAESALNRGLVSQTEWDALLERLPRNGVRAVAGATGASGSGIESMFVHRIKRLGAPVRQQKFISGVGYVDVVLGEKLIVELDGEAFHRDAARDRRRDAVSSISGYRVLRFLANQVLHEWQLVEDAVVAALSRGDHRAA